MRGARFTVLARIDDLRFITACPHGMAHLTWERATLRFPLDEFGGLARIMGRATASPPPVDLHDGTLRVAWRQDMCELQAGAVLLRLRPAEFRRLAGAVQEAQQRLEELLASGAWEETPEEGADPFAQLRRNPFSLN